MVTISSLAMTGSAKGVTQSLYIFLYMVTIFGASPRVGVNMVSKAIRHQKDRQEDYIKHWRQYKDAVSKTYQAAHSDAMQLYSIGAGQLVRVQKMGQPWDNEYELSALTKGKGKGGKQNKFITETISYGRLKIRSEENQMYICAKNNGNILFKKTADKIEKTANKLEKPKKRPRKRCLFMWSFTEEKHIQLSIHAGGTEWFLSVRHGSVKLLPKDKSTSKQRSFIWLPTRSANRGPVKYTRVNRYDTHARGFSLMNGNPPNDCVSLNEKLNTQKDTINELNYENLKLRAEIIRLKKVGVTTTKLVHHSTITSSDAR